MDRTPDPVRNREGSTLRVQPNLSGVYATCSMSASPSDTGVVSHSVDLAVPGFGTAFRDPTIFRVAFSIESRRSRPGSKDAATSAWDAIEEAGTIARTAAAPDATCEIVFQPMHQTTLSGPAHGPPSGQSRSERFPLEDVYGWYGNGYRRTTMEEQERTRNKAILTMSTRELATAYNVAQALGNSDFEVLDIRVDGCLDPEELRLAKTEARLAALDDSMQAASDIGKRVSSSSLRLDWFREDFCSVSLGNFNDSDPGLQFMNLPGYGVQPRSEYPSICTPRASPGQVVVRCAIAATWIAYEDRDMPIRSSST